ncbi:Xanthine dehydrogenase/oxidase [Orchesella cincta]|uniref:Xanthine dehydrogenase/oxidase n=1 Tax=Orchesella cincta TaxID=48709 RepID=A0A1D2N811_ORCCI|nr:Xanthine dehydrogenase/oxidase [Orchesella cincta]
MNLWQANEYVWAVKQARRREDDIAIVNACMRVVVNPATLNIEDALLVYGGMAPTTKIAKITSQFLLQKKWSENTFDTAANELYEEMKLEANAPGGMVAYRQVLTQSFLSKFFLTVSSWMSPTNISLSGKEKEKSAVFPITRGETSGVQLYQIVPKSQKVEDLIGRPIAHLSALKHATGEAVYTDDEVPLLGQLHGALVGSPIAHGKIISIDASKALALPGVVEFLSAKSIPADHNVQGHIIDDEEIFASEYVHCQGQTIGIIVAVDPLTAEKASKLVEMKFEELTPILTIEDAVKKESYHAVRKLRAGNIAEAFEKADEILEGEMRIGGQEHFYMEPQSCIATPKEDQEMDILMSCQGPDYVQKLVAKALKIPANRVKVRCRRMGGGFGGKESRTCLVSLPTVMAAVKLGKSVKTVMNRWDDMVVTGGRHPFQCRYKLAITKEGRILGVQATLYSNGGCSSDASPPVMEKALMSIEAVYTIPHWDMHGFACKTNLASNTAFRGYGGPQASIFMENIIDAVAEKVGKSPVEIREMHLQQQNGDKSPMGYVITDCMVRKCWEECVRGSNYQERKAKVDEFNKENHWKKRGITVTPMKHNVGFHMSLLNQGGALVMIYTDGSVGLNHGGTEMGQGLHTKMAQIASRALGIPIAKIYQSEASTDKVPNATATCASMSSDLNGMAVMYACQKLAKRLEPFKKANPNGTWEDWVGAAYFNRVNLSAVGFFELDLNYDFDNPQDLRRDPQFYVVYGVAVSEVEVDCLMITKGPGMYKIPSMGDIPRVFNVSMLRGAPNPKAVYSSKGLGEPPLFLAASIFFAIKEAIKAARKEVGLSPLFRFDAPATVERIRLACEDEKVDKVKEGMKGSEGKPGWAITQINMDFQNQLLNCEIQHLGQMLQVISGELTILQDFLKDKFGPDYELFRESVVSQQHASTSSKSATEFQRGHVPARKSTSSRKDESASKQAQEEEDLASDMEVGSESDVDVDGNEVSSSLRMERGEMVNSQRFENSNKRKKRRREMQESDFDNEGSVMVENTDDGNEANDGTMQETYPQSSSKRVRKGGRQRSRIWQEFTRVGDNSWACNHCKKEFKCPQADRLDRHVFKCLTGEKPPKKNPVKRSRDEGTTESVSIGEDQSETERNETTSMNSFLESVPSSSGRGRKLDPVWAYFTIREDPVTKKKTADCKNCNLTIKGKVEPARKHFYACHQLDEEVVDDKT